jgi:predicted enzyme involved in methoxymalonyl-ACP biosynthesis
VLTCRPRAGEPDALVIDNWLMSCRVLGRMMEHFMLAVAVEQCRAAGVRHLYGEYLPTAKNAQVADLLPRLGFTPCGGDEGHALWRLDLRQFVAPACPIQSADERTAPS